MSDGSRRSIGLWALLSANAISMVGNQLALLSIPWFVLTTTGSAAKTGLTAAFSVLPIVLAGFFGGVVIDRLGHRKSSIAADVVSGLPIAAIPLLYSLHSLPFGVLLGLVFISAFFDGPGTTAREALIPDLAETANVSLERASSLLQIVERGSRLAGAPLAGVLIGVVGAQNVLWVDAATFGVSAFLIAAFVPRSAKSGTVSPSGSYLRQLSEGVRYIARDRLLRLLVFAIVITNLLDTGKISVLYPLFARHIFHSSTVLGLMIGIAGGGAVIGAALYTIVGRSISRRWTVAVGFVCTSIAPLAFSALPPLWAVLGIQLIAGIASGPINPILMTVQYERVPKKMLGRVLGAITASVYAGMPLGGLLAGYAAQYIGLRTTLFLVGAIYLVATTAMAVNPTLKLLERDDRGTGVRAAGSDPLETEPE